MASGVLTTILTTALTRRIKPEATRHGALLLSQLFPSLGLLAGKSIARHTHESQVLAQAPPAPFTFLPELTQETPVYDASDESIDRLLSTSLAWATSVGAVSATSSAARWASRGRWILKGTRWNVLGLLASGLLTTYTDQFIFDLINRMHRNEFHQELYQAIEKLDQMPSEFEEFRFRRLILAKKVIQATYKLFFFMIYPIQKSIQAYEENMTQLEEAFYEKMDSIDPKSVGFQAEKRKLGNQIHLLRVSLSKELMPHLEQSETMESSHVDRPYTRFKLRSLIQRGEFEGTTHYGPEADELIESWATKAAAKNVQNFGEFLAQEQEQDFLRQKNRLLITAHQGHYLHSPTQLAFSVLGLLRSLEEPLLEDEIIDLMVLLDAYESQLEAYVLLDAEPIPLASDFKALEFQSAFQEFLERTRKLHDVVQNPETSQPVRKMLIDLIQSDAEGIAEILSHFSPKDLNRFYLEFLSRQFLTNPKNWRPIQSITQALERNSRFQKRLEAQANQEIQSPSLQTAERIVASWLLISMAKGGMKAIGFWSNLKELTKKLGSQLGHRISPQAQKLVQRYRRLHRQLYRSVPTRWARRQVHHRVIPSTQTLLPSIPAGAAWLWIETALQTQIIDPSQTLAQWQLIALSQSYERLNEINQTLRNLKPQQLRNSNELQEIETLLEQVQVEVQFEFEKALQLQSAGIEIQHFFDSALVPLHQEVQFQITRWTLLVEKSRTPPSTEPSHPDKNDGK